jgi:hypothetical protein
MDAKRKSKTLSVIPTNANEKGIVLVGAIALVAILALLGTVGVVTTSTEIIISKNYKTSVQARYVTEAGIHRTIGMLNSSPGWIAGLADPTSDAFPGDNSFGNGTYVVKVYEDDPTPGKIRIITTGDVNGSSSTFEAIVSPKSFEIFDYATFDCGNITLKEGLLNKIIGDVFVGENATSNGTLDLEESGLQIIEGNVYATRDIIIGGESFIIGNANANRNIDLESTYDPNIEGDATAGGVVSGTGTVSGNVCPPGEDCPEQPVTDLCDGDTLANIAITSKDIQGFRDDLDTFTIDGNYEYASADNFSGIVHITQDFELTVDSTFSEDLILVVDGDVDISARLESTNGTTVCFIVPNGNFKVKGGGNVIIDGTVFVGTVTVDEETGEFISVSGGDVKVTEGSNLTIIGNLVVVDGNIDAGTGGTFLVDQQSANGNSVTKPNSYAMMQWREIRN